MANRHLDIVTVLGFVLGTMLLIGSVLSKGQSLLHFVDLGSALLVVGGSVCAVMVATPLVNLKEAFRVARHAFQSEQREPGELITNIVRFAEKARKDGILALEAELENVDDDFLIRGVQMAVDGSDPELIHQTMLAELEQLDARHDHGQRLFTKWGLYLPAFGLIGTLVGLILMLTQLGGDMSAIGPSMALALVTTLYGATLANFVALPIADKLEMRHLEERLLKILVINGVMSIQSGDNPKIVEQKLKIFLPPGMREEEAPQKGKRG